MHLVHIFTVILFKLVHVYTNFFFGESLYKVTHCFLKVPINFKYSRIQKRAWNGSITMSTMEQGEV